MNLVLGLLFFFVGQTVIWFVTNAQFLNEWSANRPWVMTLIAMPVTYLFILATKYLADYFNGAIWPGRLIGFATGMIIFTLLTSYLMKEPFTAKIAISLTLATMLVCIQVFWK